LQPFDTFLRSLHCGHTSFDELARNYYDLRVELVEAINDALPLIDALEIAFPERTEPDQLRERLRRIKCL